jgi:hypothetical protein
MNDDYRGLPPGAFAPQPMKAMARGDRPERSLESVEARLRSATSGLAVAQSRISRVLDRLYGNGQSGEASGDARAEPIPSGSLPGLQSALDRLEEQEKAFSALAQNLEGL